MTVTVFTNPSNPQCKATEQELSKLGVHELDKGWNDLNGRVGVHGDKLAKFPYLSANMQGADIAPTSSASWRKASRRRRGNSSQASRQPEGTNPKRQ